MPFAMPPVEHERGDAGNHDEARRNRRAIERGERSEGDERRSNVAEEVERDDAELLRRRAQQGFGVFRATRRRLPRVARHERHEAQHAEPHGEDPRASDSPVEHALIAHGRSELPVQERGEPAEQRDEADDDERFPDHREIGAQKGHAGSFRFRFPSIRESPL